MAAKSLFKRIDKKEVILFLGIAAVFALIFKLVGHIPEGAADAEIASSIDVSSVSKIIANPINAHYKIASLLATKVSMSILALRLVSFLLFTATCYALFYTLRHWHTKHAAGLATIAFATNSIALSVGRLGAPYSVTFTWFIFTALLLWRTRSKSTKLLPFISITAIAALLYSPGAPWFFVVICFANIDKFKKFFKNIKILTLLPSALITIGLLAPLIYSFTNDTQLIRDWLLLPENLNLSEIPRQLLRVPSAFLYRMPDYPLLTIGRLPVFDLASGFLFLIGLKAYAKNFRLERSRIMAGSIVVGLIIGGLGQTMIAVLVLMPFAFSMVAAGIEYLLDEWSSVFPRNPIAKSFGVLMITTVVLFGSYYQLTRFLVVWPQTPETRAIYHNSRIINTPPITDTINTNQI